MLILDIKKNREINRLFLLCSFVGYLTARHTEDMC